MKRLESMNLPPDSAAAELVAALKSVEPLNASPERKARVLASVLVRRHARRPALFARLSPAAVVIAILSLGIATAAATMAPWGAWRWLGGGAAVSESRLEVRAEPPRPARVLSAGPGPSQPVPELTPPAHPARAPRPRAGESPSRLMAAVRALRSDHQPARAERLALEYLRVYPRGALAEEALAVAIEAAALNGDPQARRLADRYLREYPTGRFQRLAQQARAQTP